MTKRKPNHPGVILDELYLKPLDLNLYDLAENLGISRNTLFKIRTAKAGITPRIALRLAITFGTTPTLWLNLQQKYDLWVEMKKRQPKSIRTLHQLTRAIKKRGKISKAHRH